MTDSDRTLTKNGITNFILRFDLLPNTEVDFIQVINNISANYDRVEKKIKSNLTVNVNDTESNLDIKDSIDYVLIKENQSVSITFSSLEKAFWLQTNQYLNNETYKGKITEIIGVLNNLFNNVVSKRIGMRFINQYNCNSLRNVTKIFNSIPTKSVTHMANQENVMRVIAQEEFNYDIHKLRVQYGIPNKFYPSSLKNFDLLLDIDAYDDTHQVVDDWENIIGTLNHVAYSSFTRIINPKYLKTLR